jgi:hypothetical protein
MSCRLIIVNFSFFMTVVMLNVVTRSVIAPAWNIVRGLCSVISKNTDILSVIVLSFILLWVVMSSVMLLC